MRTVIIEDEKLAADRLEELIKEIDPGINVDVKLTSIKESVDYLMRNSPDLIFLDIQLSDGMSFKILEEVNIDAPIIFTTAYDQFAIKAFKFNSIDYLLKPIRREELAASLAKYRKWERSNSFDYSELIETLSAKQIRYKSRFLIQFAQKIKSVDTEDIAFFYAMDKSVFMKTFEKNDYPVDFTLDKLEEVLDPDNFFRINRKLIISFKSIKSMIPYSRSRIKIETAPQTPADTEAIVSVERASTFKSWLDR